MLQLRSKVEVVPQIQSLFDHRDTVLKVTRLEKKNKAMLSQRSEVLAYEIPYTHTH